VLSYYSFLVFNGWCQNQARKLHRTENLDLFVCLNMLHKVENRVTVVADGSRYEPDPFCHRFAGPHPPLTTFSNRFGSRQHPSGASPPDKRINEAVEGSTCLRDSFGENCSNYVSRPSQKEALPSFSLVFC
jgi:hypothetical protein